VRPDFFAQVGAMPRAKTHTSTTATTQATTTAGLPHGPFAGSFAGLFDATLSTVNAAAAPLDAAHHAPPGEPSDAGLPLTFTLGTPAALTSDRSPWVPGSSASLPSGPEDMSSHLETSMPPLPAAAASSPATDAARRASSTTLTLMSERLAAASREERAPGPEGAARGIRVSVPEPGQRAALLPALLITPRAAEPTKEAPLSMAAAAMALPLSSQQTMRELSLVVAELRTRVDAAVGAAAARREAAGLAPRVARDVEDSLWSERATAGQRKAGAREAVSGVDDVARDERARDERARDDGRRSDDSAAMKTPSPSPWSTLPSPSATTEQRLAVRDVPPGPLSVTVDHLRALLPEGGRLLEVRADHVRLELAHPTGPMLLELSVRSGVVDVRARGGAAAEMAWRVPELAAALQSAGVRLGAFEVQPVRKGEKSSSTDDGRANDRQNSDDPANATHRPAARRAVSAIGSSHTSTARR